MYIDLISLVATALIYSACIDGLAWVCSISIANALEVLQSCARLSILYISAHKDYMTNICCTSLGSVNDVPPYGNEPLSGSTVVYC